MCFVPRACPGARMLVRTFLVGLVAVVAAGKNDRLTTAMTFPPSHSRQSSQVVAAPSPVIGDSSNFSMDRRKCLANCITLPIFTAAASGAGAEEDLKMSQQLASFQVFQVELDDSAALNPKLNLQNNDDFIERAASTRNGSIWLGEHHNSNADHNLQVDLLRQISNRRLEFYKRNSAMPPSSHMAIGLEQVQVQFQPILDAYLDAQISIEELRSGVEWDTRWIWPFEGYQPVFELARELQIPLVALNVDSEDLIMVEKGGLPNLPRDRLQQYIRDGPGFASFTLEPQFRAYVNYVIEPSYQVHREMGLLQYTMSGVKLEEPMPFRNFLSGRILWDEAMASNAYEWTRKNKGGLLVGIVGADHVKFRYGIPGRYSRMTGKNGADCISVMLNPTLIDTLPPGTTENTNAAMSTETPENIMLQLRYLKANIERPDSSIQDSTGGVLPLADYLVIGR